MLACVPILCGPLVAQEVKITEDSQECIDCHSLFQPGVVGSWQKSRHARVTPLETMTEAWTAGLASGPNQDSSPFDEDVERRWANIWLIHANTIRFASAMGCGGDYGVFADGRYELNKAVVDLLSRLEQATKR